MLKFSKASFNVRLTKTSRFVKLNSYTSTPQPSHGTPQKSVNGFKVAGREC
jgi:hypothetical protein